MSEGRSWRLLPAPTGRGPAVDRQWEFARNIPLGSLDTPDLLTPTYESWTVRRESWLPPFPLTRLYERDRDPSGRIEE
ncbi:hypothetical protein D9M68_1000990 [compost metagenome]